MIIRHARHLPTSFVLGTTQSGNQFLSLIVKATFSAAPTYGAAQLAPRQLPVLKKDVLFDPDKPDGLLRFESDLVPFKPRSDIILVGDAWTPYGRPTSSLDVEIRVGRTCKLLRVFGDRLWSYGPGQGAPIQVGPAEFGRMPLTYDLAFGGIDQKSGMDALYPRSKPWYPENVHGRGYIGARTAEAIHGRPLPNIEDPRALIRSWDACPRPAGCGFYPRNSESRARHAGTLDEKWKAERAPDPPLDFSFEIYNAAHPDLQVPNYLVGNEAVRLTNVDPRHPELTFRLPCLQPRVQVKQRDITTGQMLPTDSPLFCLDTLVFVPGEKIFYQVWRALIGLRDPNATGLDEMQIDYEKLAPAEDPPEFSPVPPARW